MVQVAGSLVPGQGCIDLHLQRKMFMSLMFLLDLLEMIKDGWMNGLERLLNELIDVNENGDKSTF